MNLYYPVLLLALYITYRSYRYFICLYGNLVKARRSGLNYVISPIWPLKRIWLIFESVLVPHIKKLPWVGEASWLLVSGGDWAWNSGYTQFEKLGDTFMIVTPHRNIVYTADPVVISAICQRRNDFPKPLELYGTIAMYGSNVVVTEGSEWRRHRKVTAPPFSEKNNHLVWKESLYQAQNMLKQWTGAEGKGGLRWDNISNDAMRLSLHVISRAGFSVRCLWPGVDDNDEQAIRNGAMSTAIIPDNHQMSYVEAMQTLLHRIIIALICPDWFANLSRIGLLKTARKAYYEWGQYMKEIYDRKFEQLSHYTPSNEDEDPSLDLMGAMIESSGLLQRGSKKEAKAALAESEIIGNSFIFMLAGHETAANTITHALYFLAMEPQSQRRVQRELDEVLGGRTPDAWNYDRDLPPLFGGILGATMNETLRLLPPVITIPKSTYHTGDQKIKLDTGKEVVIPDGTYVGLVGVAAHRNPKYWPNGPARSDAESQRTEKVPNDLEEFKPDRWLLAPGAKQENDIVEEKIQKEAADVGFDTAPDTAPSLFRPAKGAYLPFSEGFRACLGRRFAQVEIIATLAVVLQHYSIELDATQWATDEEIKSMSPDEKQRVFGKARSQAERYLRENMATIITLQLRGATIPVRFVRRGEETFS